MNKLELELRPIPLEQMEPWEEVNVRRIQITTQLDELVESIRRTGLLEPIIVQSQDSGKYKIIIGQRRYLAFKQLAAENKEKWGKIPAIVRQFENKVKATVASMVENTQRREISARDKAATCKFLLEKFGSIKAVSEELGTTEKTVRKWLGYHGVPESIKAKVDEGKLSPTEAIEISANVADEDKALAIAETIAQKKMTKPEKERVINVLADEPQLPNEEIFKEAEKRKQQEEIHFILPTKYAEGLSSAATEEGVDTNGKAKGIVMEWVRANRYL